MFFKRGNRTTDQLAVLDAAVRPASVWQLVWPIHVRPSELVGVAVVGALTVAACWPVLQLPFAGPDVTTRLVDCSESSAPAGSAGSAKEAKNTFLAHIELHNHTGDTRSVALTDHAGADLAPNGAGGYATVILNPYETRVVPYEFAEDGTACASYTGDVVAATGTARGTNYSPPAQDAAPLPTPVQTPPPSAPTTAAPDPNSLYLVISDKDEQPPARTFWDTAVAELQAANPGVTVHVSFDTPSGLAVDSMVYPGPGARPDAADLILGAPPPSTPGTANASTSYYPAGAILPGSVTADLLPGFDYQERVPGPGGAPVQYGIPFSGSTYALYYNKHLFARAHIAEPPATWSELAADAAKIKALGVDGYGLKSPLGGDAAVMQLWMSGNGGDFMDAAKKKWTLNSPANVAAFQWLADNLMKPGLATSPGFSADPGLQFAEGALGMTVAGPDLITKAEADTLGTAFGVAPVPGRTRPLTSPTGSADDLLATKAHPERKALIAKFVAFLLSSKNQKRYADLVGGLPVTRSGTTAEAGNPLLKPFLDGMAKADWLPTRAPSWQVVQVDLYQGFSHFPAQNAQTVLDQVQAEIPVQP